MLIPPNVNLLKSFRGARVDYLNLSGEAIDNSFDAAAKAVDVIIMKDQIQIRDDGVGVSKNRLSALFSPGEHGGMSTTQLGRFGVGIKTQAINCGDVFSVDSTSKDGRFRAFVDWPEILHSGKWEISDPIWLPSEVGAQTGTIISISGLRSRPKINIEKLSYDIAVRFYPGIADSRTIRLNGMSVPLLTEPEMTDIVDAVIPLSGGRSAHLRAGILVSPSQLSRVHVGYRHRVIIPASTFGCGEYGGGLNKMFARLQLMGPWHLSTFKSDLTDEDERDELETSVEEILSPILKKCHTATITAKLADMEQMVNDLVPDRLAARRPRHLKPPEEQDKPKRPRRPGLVHQNKSDEDGPAGTYKTRRRTSKLLITFDGVNEQVGIGALRQGGKIDRIELAKDNPYIAGLLSHRDKEWAAQSLAAVAFLIFEHCRAEQELPFVEWAIGQRVARHLCLQDSDSPIADIA